MQVDAMVNPKIPPKIITVGNAGADVPGFTSAAIQTAIDALRNHGGGTIKLTPGTFAVIAPVRLYDNMTLLGSDAGTTLRKTDGVRTSFIDDADYGELKLTVADPTGFVSGMGVQIYDSTIGGDCWGVTTTLVTAVEGNTIYIRDYLLWDYDSDKEGVIENACSIIAAVQAENVRIADLTIDGNKAANGVVNGCVGGAVYLHKTKNALVENLIVKDWNGDGISWQITEDVTVRNCEVYGCTNIGLHPGTGSPNTVIEGNNSHDNQADGLFVCWRVRNGLVKNNKLHHNGRHGICTGHKDTDIVFQNNHIYANGIDGVNLRNEKAKNAPHGSIFRNNVVENNGVKNGGYGFAFKSPPKDVVVENNTIRDTGAGTQKAAIFTGKNALPVTLKGNKMSGHPQGDVIYEKK